MGNIETKKIDDSGIDSIESIKIGGPFDLVIEYLEKLCAPHKNIIWFEHCDKV